MRRFALANWPTAARPRRSTVYGLPLLLLAAICLLPAAGYGQCGPGGCSGGECVTVPWLAEEELATSSPAALPQVRDTSPRGRWASVLRIQTADRDGRKSFGSGVAIRWGDRIVILTARHVVADARKVWARGRTEYYEVGVLRTDPVWDVAVLTIPPNIGSDEFAPAELAWRETGHPKAGDALESCGFGPDGQLAVNRGRFVGYRTTLRDRSAADWLVLSGAARQGDSGGPVFNAQGEVVGVVWGTDNREVVATQCGRLHVLLREAIGEPRVAAKIASPAPDIPRCNEPATAAAVNVPAVCVADRRLRGGNLPNKPGFLGSGEPVLNPSRPSLLPICRPRVEEPPARSTVIVQSDPSVASIDRKMDVVIQNTTPRPEPAQSQKAQRANSLVMLAVVAGCVVLGFVVYFATQRAD